MAQHYHALIGGEQQGAWPGLQRAGLRVLSVPYSIAVRGRNWLYDHGWKKSYRAGAAVISVGNLTAGGTGKTPCVEYVARHYRQRGQRVAILSRGYGSEGGRNDEALVLEQNLPDVPHLQGADRSALARIAIEELDSEVLVLDDGFQHRRLARDLDLVLVDATLPWGHGYVLPRGLLREPRSSLGRAGAVVLTRCDLPSSGSVDQLRSEVASWAPGATLVESEHRPVCWQSSGRAELPLQALRGRPIAAFCGIGNPDAFRQTLAKLGLDVAAWRTFPDHHRYGKEDVEELRRWARMQSAQAALVTTQKDLVKIRVERLGERDLWALRIQLHLRTGQAEFETLLDRALLRGEEVSSCN